VGEGAYETKGMKSGVSFWFDDDNESMIGVCHVKFGVKMVE
jgi:hypothetical protein